MSWKDQLQPASFRGVSFFYLSADLEFGRRGVDHEFPFRETGYGEDLGKKTRIYRLRGYVIGDNYFSDRDALLTALETPGSGTLVHPYRGAILVNVRPGRLSERWEEGRIAQFDMVFADAGAQPSPTSATDTAGTAAGKAADANSQLGISFSADFDVLNWPNTVTAAANNLVTSAQAALTGLLATPVAFATNLQGMVSSLTGLVEEPGKLAAQVTNFFNGFVDGITASFDSLIDTTTTSRGPVPIADPSYGLGAVAAWGASLPAINPVTPALAQEAANQAAMIALINGGAAAAMVQVYAATDFASENDAEAARDQITDILDDLSVAASDAGDDAAYASLQLLYQTVTADLTTRGKQLPNVETYTFAEALPALFLAQRLYQDASQAGYLIARNAAPHPLFMPVTIEALTSSSGPPSV
jgi:prophage DNA circulation protein